MDLAKISVIYDKCTKCNTNRVKEVCIPLLDKQARIAQDEIVRLCGKCKADENQVVLELKINSESVQERKAIWLKNRALGIKQPDFKY